MYLAKKGNVQFYIQPDMLEMYAAAGYTIYKMEAVEVEDVSAEQESATAEMTTEVSQSD